jgi:5'-nucleotidase
VLSHIVSLPTFPANTLLNINLPPVPGGEVKGIRLTRLGRRVYSQSVTPLKDPWGRQIYWIGGGDISWTGEPDSDFRAIDEGFVSITPLHLDLTHHSLLQDARTWWKEL